MIRRFYRHHRCYHHGFCLLLSSINGSKIVTKTFSWIIRFVLIFLLKKKKEKRKCVIAQRSSVAMRERMFEERLSTGRFSHFVCLEYLVVNIIGKIVRICFFFKFLKPTVKKSSVNAIQIAGVQGLFILFPRTRYLQ